MHVIIDGTITQDQMAYAGPGQYAKNIVLHLIKEFPSTKYSLLLFDGKESTVDEGIKDCENVEIVRIGDFKINDYKNDIWYYTKVLPIIKKIRNKDSVFFSPHFWRNFPSYSMPTVLFVHDMNLPMFNMYSQQSVFHNFVRKIQYWLTLNKSLKCKYILCNSKTTMNDYLKYYPKFPRERIGVSYLGIDLEEKEFPLSDILPSDYKDRGYVIYLGGGINWSKNSEGVIKGYASFVELLGKKNPPYLVVAGGKFQDKSKKEVVDMYKIMQERDIEDSVLFTGFYADEAKYSLLKESFAFIHLSLAEGFGIAPSEALRAKVPTILHKSPVYEELFSDVSILVNGKDEEEVGKAIYDVYMKRDSYTDMIERGYVLSKKYTWSETARITHEVLAEV